MDEKIEEYLTYIMDNADEIIEDKMQLIYLDNKGRQAMIAEPMYLYAFGMILLERAFKERTNKVSDIDDFLKTIRISLEKSIKAKEEENGRKN